MRQWTRIGMVLAVLPFAGCATDYENKQKAKRHTDMATAQFHSGNYTAALKELLGGGEADPGRSAGSLLPRPRLRGEGDEQRCGQEAKKAVELKPDYSEAHNDLGKLYFNMGQYDSAIESFNRALANPLYESPSFPLYNMGRAYYMKGDYMMALAKYDEAVAREPNTPHHAFHREGPGDGQSEGRIYKQGHHPPQEIR